MLKFYANVYVLLSNTLGRFQEMVDVSDDARKFPLTDASRDTITRLVEVLRASCAEIGLSSTIDQVNRWEAMCRSGPISINSFDAWQCALQERLFDELGHELILHVPRGPASFYDVRMAFGEDVALAFPSAIIDIEEAGNCLALGRNTACVLHLMRAMETVVHALADRVGVRYEYRGWEPVIKKMRSELEKSYDDIDHSFKGHKEFFSNALDRLTAVKDALRNPTMHARIDYDAQRGEDVFRAVRTFMQLCAQELKETLE